MKTFDFKPNPRKKITPRKIIIFLGVLISVLLAVLSVLIIVALFADTYFIDESKEGVVNRGYLVLLVFCVVIQVCMFICGASGFFGEIRDLFSIKDLEKERNNIRKYFD